MAGAAAIFDLDRMLLPTSSSPAWNQARFDHGVARRSSVPEQRLMMRFYDGFGETLASMPGLTGTDFRADTERIMAAITAQLRPEARLRRIPSAAELARSMPPGHAASPGRTARS